MTVTVLCSQVNKYIKRRVSYIIYNIPLFHTGPESHELTQIDEYLYSWLNRTQFVKILNDSHSP